MNYTQTFYSLFLSLYPGALYKCEKPNTKQLPTTKIKYCTKPQKTKLISKNAYVPLVIFFQPRFNIHSTSLKEKENAFLVPKLILNFNWVANIAVGSE